MGKEFWQGKRVLITGINGFMGGWLAEKLVACYALVEGIDKSGPDLLFQHPGTGKIAVYHDDIRDFHVMEGLAPQIVFHFAANSGVEDCRQVGYEAIDTNVRGTYSILEGALRQTLPPIVIVATSNHVYGGSEGQISREDSALQQLDTYSASKICADVLTRAYCHNYGLPTAAVRSTNCFGPFDPHHDHIIPSSIKAILKGECPVIKSTGLTKKSYLHVEDVIDAYLLIAELVSLGHKGRAWNVAGQPMPVKQLVEAICQVMRWEKGYEILGQANDQRDEYLDCSRIHSFGWRPRWSLSAAVKDTADWMRRQEHVRDYSHHPS